MFCWCAPYRFIFLIFLIAYSQPNEALAQDNVYVFNHLTAEKGLSSGQYNYYIYQDQQGFVWISSINGLNRFDGSRVHQYHSSTIDTNALKSEYASQSRFFESNDGDLWFTNNICLTRYDRKKDNFHHYEFLHPNGDTAKNLYFWTYLDAETGNLFTSGDRQLFAFNIEDPESKFWVDSLYVGLKDKMFKSAEGVYYLLMCGYGNHQLEVRRYNAQTPIGSPEIFPSPDNAGINDVLFHTEELCWIATDRGLRQLNLRSGQWKYAPEVYLGDTLGVVVEVSDLKNGNLLVATQQNGIYFFNPHLNQYTGKLKTFKDDLIVPFEPKVVRMTVDYQENLWICVEDNGVFFTNLHKPKFELVLAGQGNGVNNVKALCEGQNNDIWMLLSTEVLQITASDTIRYPLPISGNDLEQSMAIFKDSSGRIWVGTLSDLFLRIPGSQEFTKVSILPPHTTKKTPGYNYFSELPNGDLLIATNALHTLQVKHDLSTAKWLTTGFTRPSYFYSGPERQLLVHTYQDSFFIGHFNEVWEYEIDTTFQTLPYVTSIHYDKNQDFYWVTTFHGLYRISLQNGEWDLSLETNLPEELIINSCLVDDQKRLWLGIPGGLMVYDPETSSQTLFSKRDGLQGPDYNINSTFSHSDGRFFFGGTNGVTHFRPEEISITVPPARPTIVGISINQEKNAHLYSPQGEKNPLLINRLRLPYSKNNISLDIAALEYSAPILCQFKYQLLGSNDTSIIFTGNNSQIDFRNMSPGNYLLKVWASNSDGAWSDQVCKLYIDLFPPWYQSWWFYLASSLMLAGLFYGFYRYRLREITQKQNLEKAAAEAKRLAAETETAILRLQMNPHFIFNSLNSIDAYILQGDKLKAHDFLTNFAGLMRGILNNSENPMTNLDDEITLLQQYLQAEKMRIGPRLSFAFDISPDIDTYATEIPTMILQPFVENAIWHGISPKTGPGHIQISFQLKNKGELLCEVKDNGVGRGKGNGTKNHISKSQKITQRRLALLRQNATLQAPHFSITDLVAPDGTPDGTCVRFYFPLNWM